MQGDLEPTCVQGNTKKPPLLFPSYARHSPALCRSPCLQQALPVLQTTQPQQAAGGRPCPVPSLNTCGKAHNLPLPVLMSTAQAQTTSVVLAASPSTT